MNSSKISPKEKLKNEYADYLTGLNSMGTIDYFTYNELFDLSMIFLDDMYELGREYTKEHRKKNKNESIEEQDDKKQLRLNLGAGYEEQEII